MVKNNKLKSVTTPANTEAVDGNFKTSNYFTEEIFIMLFSKMGFDVSLIVCGDRVGQGHPCYTQAEEGDKLTAVYISAVLEKPLLPEEYPMSETVRDEL